MHQLTIPQHNIWNLQRYYQDTSISNNCGAVFYDRKCDHRNLCRALNKLIELQDGMRLRFAEADGVPIQYVAEYAQEAFPSMYFENMDQLNAYAAEFAKIPFRLTGSPMYRFVPFDVGDCSGVLMCTSHLISDAWAISIISRTVSEWKDAFEQGTALEEKKRSFLPILDGEKNYLASARYEKDKAYWTARYPTRPEPSSIRPGSVPAGAAARRYSTTLTPEFSAAIDGFYTRHHVSQAVLFEAAIMTYLSRINPDNRQISLGILTLNRSGAAEKSTVGNCISTLPLTVDLSGEETAEALCQAISAGHFQIFRHQKFPYSHILHGLHERFGFSGNLYDVMVSFQNAKTGTADKTKWYSNGFCEVPLEFHIDNRDGNDYYTLNIDYQTGLFETEEEIRLLVGRILFILEQIIEAPDRKVAEIAVLPGAEYRKVLYGFNDTAVDIPRDACIQDLFARCAAQMPDKTALVFEHEKFTFRQLDKMSNSLARHLRDKGVGPNVIVPIVSRRSWHVIAAMLGVLKAGGAYMHVDTAYPADRIAYMFETAQCHFALTYGYEKPLGVETTALEQFDFTGDVEPVGIRNDPEDLCYVIFTSGSTGKPKGLMIAHRNAINFAHQNPLNVVGKIIPDNDRSILAISSTSFDMSVTETLLPLMDGMTIYLANDDQILSQGKLQEVFRQGTVHIMETTPTKMRLFMADREHVDYLQSVEAFILGGEELPMDLYRELREITSAKIFNNYGPAETTVWSTIKQMQDDVITIGKPIANTQVYILDPKQQPVPVGIAGELYISGDGVGKGYLNRPDLTAERFLPDPFRPGNTMYRTGDLGRWRTDGEIDYLGRIDTQVKIRGLRVELGEIENTMTGFEGIAMAAVADKRDENGRQYLVGYYTSALPIDETALRQMLAAKLPKYMVPHYFMRLPEMPMTTSGKTDRKNLPLPVFAQSERHFAAPETPTEQKLSAMWEALLKADRVGRHDDFFEMGGDSLIAIHLQMKLEDVFHIAISVKDILEHSQLCQLAACIDSAQNVKQAIVPGGAKQYALLPQQMAIYAVCSKDPDSLAYNMPARIPLPAGIDREKLTQCLLRLPALHPELKTAIRLVDGIPTAVMEDDAPLAVEEWQDACGFTRPFDLTRPPLMRVGFTKDALLFDMHHIIADGESLNIILRDLAALYADTEPRPAAICYADYAAHFRRADFSKHGVFFKNMLQCDFEPMQLPERAAPGADRGISRFYQLDRETFEAGRAIARAHRLTDTMVFLGAYGILLSKFTGRADVLSSIIMANRSYGETENVLGMFVNTLPVALSVKGSAQAYFARIRELVLELFEYQEMPFFSIAEAVGMGDMGAVNTAFVYQADGAKALRIGDEKLLPEWVDTHFTKFDLSFEMTPNHDGCAVRMEFNCGKYDEALMDRLFEGYRQIILQLGKAAIGEISVLGPAEYRKVIYDFNDTGVSFDRTMCVQDLFARQVERTPDKVAIVFENEGITYRELDRMSNSMAHFLREKGVGPGAIVPIVSRRSWHMIAAMLGVLKAGGAYMPVDPGYPAERIETMFATACCGFALTWGYCGQLPIPSAALETFDFASDPSPVEHRSTAEDLCYIIFTSGSTGTPKGVSLCHRNVVNYALPAGNNAAVQFVCGHSHSIVSTTNFIFDIFVTESLMPLCNGLTIYLANDDQAVSQRRLSELIMDHPIDVLQTTPTKMRSYIMNQGKLAYLKRLKTIILGGEALPRDLWRELRSNTDACIFNIYGPAETTVWSTNQRVVHEDITIGRPIANTQVYILDDGQCPLPIGVAGELCISGDGVGKGYLNRPDLTAERFVPNPFVPGTTMYRTGDLARFRMDGEIEYLGRIDTQVKIRGLRIELGEIESVMSSFPGIGLTAVTDKRDESGRQYLIGYYTSEASIDEALLRQTLAEKLPQYMVPNYFVRLESMPMTASGKTDRKNLPLPVFAQTVQAYLAPETQREAILCDTLAQILQQDRVGVTDDFFALGGDSLCAIEYVAQAHNCGVEFTLQNVFDYPTVRLLCGYLDGVHARKGVYDDADFVKYEPLLARNVIDETFVPVRRSLGNVFLTGATGFLGAHILDEFLRCESGSIYCLVRGGRERLERILKYYFDGQYVSAIGERILVVEGDITHADAAEEWPTDIQTVIHAAATVKHYGPYEYFDRINVQGTRNVAEYAKRIGAQMLHISTISVSGSSLVDAFDVCQMEEVVDFAERDLYIGQPLENVYIRSKFEAERVVLDAALEGLNARIIRVGNLSNRARDYRFQPNYHTNAYLNRMKAALEMGSIPAYVSHLYAEFSPVDQTAEGIVKIGQYAGEQTVFNLYTDQNLYFTRMAEILKDLGIAMEIVDGKVFEKKLQSLARDPATAYIYEAFQNDMDENGVLVYDSNIHIHNDFTIWFMRKLGFAWSEIDFAYMKGYVEYFRDLGYFKV